MLSKILLSNEQIIGMVFSSPELIDRLCRPSPSVRQQLSALKPRPIVTKFHIEPQRLMETKYYSNSLGDMTDMAITPIYMYSQKIKSDSQVRITVKILKIETPEIITIIVPQLEQMNFTVQYCVQKMQTE